MSVEQLEAMTDDELEKWCEPYKRVVVVTKKAEDDAVEKNLDDTVEPKRMRKKKDDSWFEEAQRLAATMGVELPQGLRVKR